MGSLNRNLLLMKSPNCENFSRDPQQLLVLHGEYAFSQRGAFTLDRNFLWLLDHGEFFGIIHRSEFLSLKDGLSRVNNIRPFE
jgi:hypothetical protein